MTAPRGPWVLVVGMHRSGTSAVTGSLGALGLGVVRPGDRMDWPESNPEHWESLSLTGLNNDLLARLDGAWDAPPGFPPGWELSPAVADAPDPDPLLAAAYPEPGPLVFKDPRLSLLLPYWRSVLAGPLAAVLMWRSPTAVAHSLLRRDGLPVVEGLALWERYNRAALEGLEGVDTFVLRYETLVGDPAGPVADLVDWLSSLGQFAALADGWDRPAAASAITDELHHHGTAGDADPLVPPEQRELVDRLGSLAGGHRPFPRVDLGAESAWTTSVLRLRQELSAPRRELDAARDLLRLTRNELESTKAGMANLRASTSWRITGPLRSLTTAVGGIRHRPPPGPAGRDD